MRNKLKININKLDNHRVLLTETIPSEVPIIFSNDGMYYYCKKYEKSKGLLNEIIKIIAVENNSKYTIPLEYKIKKDSASLRKLSLLHPGAQYEYVGFYNNYDDLICYYTTKSKVSIRYPYKIAGSLYANQYNEFIEKYKKEKVILGKREQSEKYITSYFAYGGYSRLYKFFGSERFLELESKYKYYWSLDVSKCFSSIYTHTLAWATKNKPFTKENLSQKTFGEVFDRLMQTGNYNETNGIVIGPEISRIFAEIIFQKIDSNVLRRVSKKYGLEHDTHYVILRYVDDIFVFSNKQKDIDAVYNVIRDELLKFNLHLNEQKTLKHSRPFFTLRSRVIHDISNSFDLYIQKFTEERGEKENRHIIPTKIFNSASLYRDFVDSAKKICVSNEQDYSAIANYIISAILNRVALLANVPPDKRVEVRESEKQYSGAFDVLIRLAYFFYGASSSVASSYNISKIIIISCRFFERYIPSNLYRVYDQISVLSQRYIDFSLDDTHKDLPSYVHLESYNIVLALTELGENYRLSEDVVRRVFDINESSGYFQLMCCLYYIKNYPQYRQLHGEVVKKINSVIHEMHKVAVESSKAYMFLDSISCPHIDIRKRVMWVKRFYKANAKGSLPSNADIEAGLVQFESNNWFINWSDVDILNSIVKKQLMLSY